MDSTPYARVYRIQTHDIPSRTSPTRLHQIAPTETKTDVLLFVFSLPSRIFDYLSARNTRTAVSFPTKATSGETAATGTTIGSRNTSTKGVLLTKPITAATRPCCSPPVTATRRGKFVFPKSQNCLTDTFLYSCDLLLSNLTDTFLFSCDLLLSEGADIQQAGLMKVRIGPFPTLFAHTPRP